MKILLHGLLLILFIAACSNKKEMDNFTVLEEIYGFNIGVDKNQLARIEGIQCNDSMLIVFDYHSGQSYTLFNLKNGFCFGRFGDIGQGPHEISLGCQGFLRKNKFILLDPFTGIIGQYDLDSLSYDVNSRIVRLTKFNIPEGEFYSKLLPVNDSLFLAAGAFHSQKQYAIFDYNGDVKELNVDIYNAYDNFFNKYHKLLSNQGRISKCPGSNRFAFTLNYSSNIDFCEVVDNKIKIIKLRRKKNPQLKSYSQGERMFVRPDLNSPIGYLDVTSGEKFVYALHSDKPITQMYSSDKVYVFDWEGNPIKEYKLDQEACYIAVNEDSNQLIAAVREEDGGWNIKSYTLNND